MKVKPFLSVVLLRIHCYTYVITMQIEQIGSTQKTSCSKSLKFLSINLKPVSCQAGIDLLLQSKLNDLSHFCQLSQ